MLIFLFFGLKKCLRDCRLFMERRRTNKKDEAKNRTIFFLLYQIKIYIHLIFDYMQCLIFLNSFRVYN